MHRFHVIFRNLLGINNSSVQLTSEAPSQFEPTTRKVIRAHNFQETPGFKEHILGPIFLNNAVIFGGNTLPAAILL